MGNPRKLQIAAMILVVLWITKLPSLFPMPPERVASLVERMQELHDSPPSWTLDSDNHAGQSTKKLAAIALSKRDQLAEEMKYG